MLAPRNFLDLFAGAGGLSEGFIRSGYLPIAHIEMDKAACFTLRTRQAYHWLKANDMLELYDNYLNRNITRSQFYNLIPSKVLDRVINSEINQNNLLPIFEKVDALLGGQPLDLIIGGPPCQAYSIIGRSCTQDRKRSDTRNYLYQDYGKFLQRYKPKYFIFENVKGLLSAKDAEGNLYLDKMCQLFQNIGYNVTYQTINAKDIGVPQHRERVILVGAYKEKRGFPRVCSIALNRASVEDIFEDLPNIQAGQGDPNQIFLSPIYHKSLDDLKIRSTNQEGKTTLHWSRNHNARDLEIYYIALTKWLNSRERLSYNHLPKRLQTHQNTVTFLDRFKVVAGELSYSHTITAHIAKDGHYYIHPDIAQNRSLTPREAARLQTFPDDYFFESVKDKPARTAPFRQIGNAVPVLLAEAVALGLREMMENQ